VFSRRVQSVGRSEACAGPAAGVLVVTLLVSVALKKGAVRSVPGESYLADVVIEKDLKELPPVELG
jgi:hypothetical protein